MNARAQVLALVVVVVAAFVCAGCREQATSADSTDKEKGKRQATDSATTSAVREPLVLAEIEVEPGTRPLKNCTFHSVQHDNKYQIEIKDLSNYKKPFGEMPLAEAANIARQLVQQNFDLEGITLAAPEGEQRVLQRGDESPRPEGWYFKMVQTYRGVRLDDLNTSDAGMSGVDASLSDLLSLVDIRFSVWRIVREHGQRRDVLTEVQAGKLMRDDFIKHHPRAAVENVEFHRFEIAYIPKSGAQGRFIPAWRAELRAFIGDSMPDSPGQPGISPHIEPIIHTYVLDAWSGRSIESQQRLVPLAPVGHEAPRAEPIPAPRPKTSGTSLPTVRVVAYEGISTPGPDGSSGYRLYPGSHQLVLNAHFGEARTVHQKDADYIVVQLLPSFQLAAQAFVKASPKTFVAYVKEIDGYHPKYLDRIADPRMLHEVSIPLVTKATPTRVTVADSSSAALRSSFVFKGGKTVSIRLRYAGNAKNWDAGFEMQKESLVTSNSATIILTDSKGKSVAPRKDKIRNLQYDQIMARPFDVTIDLVKLYDISQAGVYKLEWGCKQVQTQVVDFEIKD